MTLTLKAIRYKGQLLNSPPAAVFDKQGGKLGRSGDNALVLPDEEKVVSGEHAAIAFDDGKYYYIDTSLNGTRMADRNKTIHHEKILLEDQETLEIGDYELMLSIDKGTTNAPSRESNSAENQLSLSAFDLDGENSDEPSSEVQPEDGPDVQFTENDAQPRIEKKILASVSGSGFPIEANAVAQPIALPAIQDSDLPERLSLNDFFDTEPEDDPAGAGRNAFQRLIRQNHSIAYRPVQKPVMELNIDDECRSKASLALLKRLTSAAGIGDLNSVSEEEISKIMERAGAVLRAMIEGLMTVLRGRSESKSHLRVTMTTLKPAENNPLKFSPTVEEAIQTLFIDDHPGFMDAVDAVYEGFDDIKDHQLAVTAGIQASLAARLKQFDPRHVSEKYKGGIVFHKKAKCWDEYQSAYPQFVEKALDNFFGNEFVQAYEKQIDKLRRKRGIHQT
jgi:type VI secretion system protein ImpI/type VI secretion system protein